MSFTQLINKQSEAKTPLLIKIAVIIQIWFLFSGLITTLTKSIEFVSFLSLLLVAVQVVSLIAIWNLRKWGIIAFIALAVLGFMMTSFNVDLSAKVIIAVVIFRGIVIIPALIYWKIMS